MNSPINEKIISGAHVDDIFNQVKADFNTDEALLSYSVLIQQPPRVAALIIDIDPGGGFESGYANTVLTAQLSKEPAFDFAIHHQGVLAEIGKFFGMQDVETGYAEFDKKVIVKSNHPEQVAFLFDDLSVRSVFGGLIAFQLSTITHDAADTVKKAYLEFSIDRGLVDAEELKQIYIAFMKVLDRIDPVA